jgi:uncharacterized repeat protein (TIGR03843 family)
VPLLSVQADLPVLDPLTDERASVVLRDGEVELVGRMPWSSNATFMTVVRAGDDAMLAIYKPQIGERPLWDFPEGTLCRREVGAAVVSDLLGWSLVPDTVLRDDLPHGLGSLQRFVDHDPEEHYFTLLEHHAPEFRRFAAFDIVVNNTDRKGGHVVRGGDGRVYGIDHGVCFHPQWKVRTVIWEFGGEPISDSVLSDLEGLRDRIVGTDTALDELLAPLETAAVVARLERLLATGHYPVADDDHRHYPWPLV